MTRLTFELCLFDADQGLHSVVKTLGFNTTVTLVMTCPPFIFAGAAGIAFGWSSGRMHERTWHITAGLTIAIVGFAVAAATLNTAARYVACFIFAMGAYSVNSVIIGWASSTLSQTKEKKAVVLAMTNVGGQVRCSRHTVLTKMTSINVPLRSATSMAHTCGPRVMSRATPSALVPRLDSPSSRFCVHGGSASCLLERTGGFARLPRSMSICMGTRNIK
jgi:multisubunit Na+/H+ antiporter MnhG subunit